MSETIWQEAARLANEKQTLEVELFRLRQERERDIKLIGEAAEVIAKECCDCVGYPNPDRPPSHSREACCPCENDSVHRGRDWLIRNGMHWSQHMRDGAITETRQPDGTYVSDPPMPTYREVREREALVTKTSCATEPRPFGCSAFAAVTLSDTEHEHHEELHAEIGRLKEELAAARAALLDLDRHHRQHGGPPYCLERDTDTSTRREIKSARGEREARK